MTITLYDIASALPEKAWSPNTYKARITLNYKGLPYHTHWVELPDIEPLAKQLGVPPTSKKADGRDHYTLPIIHDTATGKTIADSLAIAHYLEATYPDTPRLFPPGAGAAVALLEHQFTHAVVAPLAAIGIAAMYAKMNPASQPYYRATREKRFGCALEAMSPRGPQRDQHLASVKAGLDLLAGFLDKNGPGQRYFLGGAVSYADVVVVAFLVWAVKFADDEELLDIIFAGNGGMWCELLKVTAKYQVVV